MSSTSAVSMLAVGPQRLAVGPQRLALDFTLRIAYCGPAAHTQAIGGSFADIVA